MAEMVMHTHERVRFLVGSNGKEPVNPYVGRTRNVRHDVLDLKKAETRPLIPLPPGVRQFPV